MNNKRTVPLWFVFLMVPPFAFLFVFGAVFGGMFIEDKIGAAAAFMFVPFYWGALIAVIVNFFSVFRME